MKKAYTKFQNEAELELLDGVKQEESVSEESEPE
jgi:hypothetical protein